MKTIGLWSQDQRLSFAARGVLAFLSPTSVPMVGAFIDMEVFIAASPNNEEDDTIEALLELELYGYVWFDGTSKYVVMDPFAGKAFTDAQQPVLWDLSELTDQL